jgi:TatD DNase family protein
VSSVQQLVCCSFTTLQPIQDRLEVIERAKRAGVQAIVVTGCTVASAQAARDLCGSITDFPLYFTAGVHPHNAKDCVDTTLDQLRHLAMHKRCLAIGAFHMLVNGHPAT